jgi:beta-1,4-mannosyl-glycoprotein beta-1,4-N-acetylglucosaminyltransferase
MTKLIDCCIFNNEVEMLNFRFHELNNVVDKFVVIESCYTFQGVKKKLVFEANKEKYNEFKDKILYIVDDKPPHPNPWINERNLRNAAALGVKALSPAPRDYIGISDIDEIPDSDTLKKLKQATDVGFLGFLHNFYYYNTSWRKKSKSHGAVFGEVEKIFYKFDFDFNEMRYAFKRADTEFKVTGHRTFDSGGWHFSYFGDTNFIINKINSFAHSEYNSDEYKNPARIKQLITEGKDLFLRGDSEDLVKVEETYLPKFIHLLT